MIAKFNKKQDKYLHPASGELKSIPEVINDTYRYSKGSNTNMEATFQHKCLYAIASVASKVNKAVCIHYQGT